MRVDCGEKLGIKKRRKVVSESLILLILLILLKSMKEKTKNILKRNALYKKENEVRVGPI